MWIFDDRPPLLTFSSPVGKFRASMELTVFTSGGFFVLGGGSSEEDDREVLSFSSPLSWLLRTISLALLRLSCLSVEDLDPVDLRSLW